MMRDNKSEQEPEEAGSQGRYLNAISRQVNDAKLPVAYLYKNILEAAKHFPSQNEAPDQEQALHDNTRTPFEESEQSFSRTQKENLIRFFERNPTFCRTDLGVHYEQSTGWQFVATRLNRFPSWGQFWTAEDLKKTWKAMRRQALSSGTKVKKVPGEIMLDKDDERRILNVFLATLIAPKTEEDEDKAGSQKRYLSATSELVNAEAPGTKKLKGAENIPSLDITPDQEQELHELARKLFEEEPERFE